ncbi:MAG: hypothetical protein J6P56_05495 [Bacteroidales bacterium]|nr:hypothetical protein [Bacteroidales bacterium]
MRICSRAYRLVLAALVLGACQAEPVAPPQVRQTIRASLEREEAVKSILDPTDDTQVLWTAGEQVNVFVGDVPYLFTGDNAGNTASATFSGTGPAELGTYVMLSPYNADASRAGETVSTTLPATQTGLAGGYQHGTAITAGLSSTESVTCRQVCSGIRFQVGRSDVTAIVLQGNGGEKIAGDFTFSFSEGVPVAGAGTENVISLSAPGGGTFELDKYYYIVTLPATFSAGIKLTAYAGTEVGTLNFSTAITFSRGQFKDLSSPLDARMTWIDSSPVSVYYGPQNSYCIRPGEAHAVSIDVSPRLIADNWQRSSLPASSGSVPNDVSVLWGSAQAKLEGSTLTMSGESAGSSLVAIKKDATILWSFLVWVTESAPAETSIGSYQVLPPLGGQLYFQWGRKDPLLPTSGKVANQGDNGLAYSIANPFDFITKGADDNAYDWFCDDTAKQDGTLWGDGGSKTVWDPCPEGYRVPDTGVFATLVGQAPDGEGFEALGYLSGDSGYHPTEPLYWTSTPTGAAGYSLFINTTPVYMQSSDRRYIAAPIRCVKE